VLRHGNGLARPYELVWWNASGAPARDDEGTICKEWGVANVDRGDGKAEMGGLRVNLGMGTQGLGFVGTLERDAVIVMY